MTKSSEIQPKKQDNNSSKFNCFQKITCNKHKNVNFPVIIFSYIIRVVAIEINVTGNVLRKVNSITVTS